jgi:error-prone DNA polymerase
VDVNRSRWESTLERGGEEEIGRGGDQETGRGGGSRRKSESPSPPLLVSPSSLPSLRLGLQMLRGMSEAHARWIVEARDAGPFESLEDFTRRTGLSRSVTTRLAKAGAFESLQLDRRGALWHALAQNPKELPLFDRDKAREGDGEMGREGDGFAPRLSSSPPHPLSPSPCLPRISPAEEVLADYRATGLSLRGHPMKFLREHLERLGAVPSESLGTLPNGGLVRVAGIVLVRQRPSTAKGITFVTLEDESGTANLIIRPDVWKRWRTAALGATILLAHGRLQRHGLVIHVLTHKLENLSQRFGELVARSRDFC